MSEEDCSDELSLTGALNRMREVLGYSRTDQLEIVCKRGELTLRGDYVSDFEHPASEYIRMNLPSRDLRRMNWDWDSGRIFAVDDLEVDGGAFHHHGYIDVRFIESQFEQALSVWRERQQMKPQAQTGRPKKVSDETILALIDEFEDPEIPSSENSLAQKIADRLSERGGAEMSERQIRRRIKQLR